MLAYQSADQLAFLEAVAHRDGLRGTAGTLRPCVGLRLLRLLKKGWQLIISGPTENALYRFGSRLAGPEYSGEYHERGVAEIRRVLQRQVSVKQISTLYWPVPLFEIFAATA